MEKLRLTKIGFKEFQDDKLIWEAPEFSLKEFNLIIGDNAQGKSRLFRTLHFLSTLVSSKPKIIPSKFTGTFLFSDGIGNSIRYELDIVPSNQANTYSEDIYKNNSLLFSTSKKVLLNEKTNENLENFFIPENIPAISSIKGDDFPTITSINYFFSGMLLVNSTKSRQLNIDENAFIPDSGGTNISSVLLNWKDKYKDIYLDVEQDFISCFKYIRNLDFPEKTIAGLKAKFLSFNEVGIDSTIDLTEWSDGLYRTLHLIMAPKTPFKLNGDISKPSLVLIDEIESGLDYKTLKFISNYFGSYADDVQFIISSHSPLVCDFVNPKNWLIASRSAHTINIRLPELTESNLDYTLDIFKHSHWQFYKEHISVSSKYQHE